MLLSLLDGELGFVFNLTSPSSPLRSQSHLRWVVNGSMSKLSGGERDLEKMKKDKNRGERKEIW
jgi:hypothetical protein